MGARTGFLRSGRIWAGLVVLGLLWMEGPRWRSDADASSEREESAGASTGEGPEARPGEAGLAIPVTVDTVRHGTLTLTVSATGQTEASDRAPVAARAGGRIETLFVTEGDLVARGQVLARMDPREHLLAVRQAEADVAEAEARFRETTLFDDRIEDAGIRKERARAARVRSGLDRAEIALSRARLDLSSTALRAPFSGGVADVIVDEGEAVAAGEDLLSVVDVDPILVEVQVVERELRWLEPGGHAEITLPAFPDTVLSGRIRSINPVVDPETRTVRVTVVVPNPEGRVLPGMFARVGLEGRRLEDRVMVPEEAIVERDERTLVFVFEPIPDGAPGEGLARWVYVAAGLSNGRYVELVDTEETDPPPPGALVITDGSYTLIHDARVRIVSDEVVEAVRGAAAAAP